jgi:O-antigen/teichoic acid export membrane protein
VSAFAFGMMGLTLLSLLLMQSDKIILSKLLSLSEFGRYTLASVFAGALYMTIAPIGQAWFPKLVELQAGNHHAKFTKSFHQGAQMVSVCMGSAAIVIMVFSENILQIWTGDFALAAKSAVLLSLLTLGNFLNGLMWIPYQAQLAHGWTGLATRINIFLILFVVPAYFLIIPGFGPEGAAWVWVCVNLCYFLVGARFMYQKILIGEMWKWYWNDILRPLIFSTAIVIFLHWVMPADLARFLKFVWILSAELLALVASILSANYVLQEVLSKIKQVKYFR